MTDAVPSLEDVAVNKTDKDVLSYVSHKSYVFT